MHHPRVMRRWPTLQERPMEPPLLDPTKGEGGRRRGRRWSRVRVRSTSQQCRPSLSLRSTPRLANGLQYNFAAVAVQLACPSLERGAFKGTTRRNETGPRQARPHPWAILGPCGAQAWQSRPRAPRHHRRQGRAAGRRQHARRPRPPPAGRCRPAGAGRKSGPRKPTGPPSRPATTAAAAGERPPPGSRKPRGPPRAPCPPLQAVPPPRRRPRRITFRPVKR